MVIKPSGQYPAIIDASTSGYAVTALEVNLHSLGYLDTIQGDGVWDSAIDAAVKKFQTKRSLPVDGVVGYRTKRSMAAIFMNAARDASKIPHGFLQSITEAESNYNFAAYLYNNHGYDCGFVQIHIMETAPDANFLNAFDGKRAYPGCAQNLRQRKEQFKSQNPDLTTTQAWQYAALGHNWPVGANTLASGQKLSEDPADWVIAIGVRGVVSPADWARYYIDKVTRYVTNYTP